MPAWIASTSAWTGLEAQIKEVRDRLEAEMKAVRERLGRLENKMDFLESYIVRRDEAGASAQ